jgi:hypothetical protein
MKIALWLEAGVVVDTLDEAMTFEVVDGDGTRWYSTDRHQGSVLCDYEWSRLTLKPLEKDTKTTSDRLQKQDRNS